jgi:hypothetical protein
MRGPPSDAAKANAEVCMLEMTTREVAYGQYHSRPAPEHLSSAALRGEIPLKPNVPRPSLSSLTSTWPKANEQVRAVNKIAGSLRLLRDVYLCLAAQTVQFETCPPVGEDVSEFAEPALTHKGTLD